MPRNPSPARARRAKKRPQGAARKSARRSARASSARAALAPDVASELKSALAALRAALESVANDLGGDDPRLERVLRAAVQTLPLARRVEALADCARGAGQETGVCTLGEIVHSVRRALFHDQGPCLLVALEDSTARFGVDAPLAVRTLLLQIESLHAHGFGPLLLRARLEEGAPSFRIAWASTQPEPDALALQRQLLRHEARCLGARLLEQSTPGVWTAVELRFARTRRAR